MMERQRPPSKVSLEDLLRLKRAERPAPEFWAEFESQLRHKQLAAIVDKRPWWRRISAANLGKISLPLGATAVLAFTLVSLRDRSQPVVSSSTVADTVTLPVAAHAHEIAESRASSVNEMQTANADSQSAAKHHTPSSVSQDQVSSNETAHAIAESSAGQNETETSLAQVILGLENSTGHEARPDFESVGTLAMDVPMDVLTPTVAMVSNPRSQVSTPQDARRARLLASLDSSERDDSLSGNSRVARSRERIANRLNEQTLYDSIRRLGVNGDSVSIKF